MRTAVFAGALCLAVAAPAHAITFATGQGTDSASCGAVTTPCRTLQQAVTNAPAGGYVVLKGPADFGPASIDKSLNIVGEDGATLSGAGAASQGGVINFVAGANDRMRVRGVIITNPSSNNVGLLWVSGKALEVASCVVQAGATFMPLAGGQVAMIDSTIELGLGAGSQTARLSSYFDGLRSLGGIQMGAGQSPTAVSVLKNSAVIGAPDGLRTFNGDFVARNALVSNGGNAISLRNTSNSIMHLSRSTMTGNAKAVDAQFASGALLTYGDNVIRGNADETLSRTLTGAYH